MRGTKYVDRKTKTGSVTTSQDLRGCKNWGRLGGERDSVRQKGILWVIEVISKIANEKMNKGSKQDEGRGPRIERTSASNQMPDKTRKQREVTVDAKRGKGSKDLHHEIASSSRLCQNPRRGPQLRGLIVTRMGRCISSPSLLMRFSCTMR